MSDEEQRVEIRIQGQVCRRCHEDPGRSVELKVGVRESTRQFCVYCPECGNGFLILVPLEQLPTENLTNVKPGVLMLH